MTPRHTCSEIRVIKDRANGLRAVMHVHISDLKHKGGAAVLVLTAKRHAMDHSQLVCQSIVHWWDRATGTLHYSKALDRETVLSIEPVRQVTKDVAIGALRKQIAHVPQMVKDTIDYYQSKGIAVSH